MLTEYEARKLTEKMSKELDAGPRAVWQCTAALLILVGLAVGGALFDLHPDRPGNMAQVQGQHQALLGWGTGVALQPRTSDQAGLAR